MANILQWQGFNDAGALSVVHLSYPELFGGGIRTIHSHSPPVEDSPPAKGSDVSPVPQTESPKSEFPQLPQPEVLEEFYPKLPQEPTDVKTEAEATQVVVPDLPLAAFGPILPLPPKPVAPPDTQPYSSPREHLDELLDVVAAQATRSIADAWDTGKLSQPALDARPYEREVFALGGGRAQSAQDHLEAAHRRVDTTTQKLTNRQLASLARGDTLPFIELNREFGLSQTAARILLAVAAPALRGEIARLYGIIANDEARPVCDRQLIQIVLAGDNRNARHEVAAELTEDAPLIRNALILETRATNDHYLFAPLSVDPVLLARLRGDDLLRGAGRLTDVFAGTAADLQRLALPQALKRDVVVALAQPLGASTALRLAIRGRPGTGRRTLLVALAARANQPLAVIHADRMAKSLRVAAEVLRIELRRARMRGAIPCISGLEHLDIEGAEGKQHLHSVLQEHPGPITFRTTPSTGSPLTPDTCLLLSLRKTKPSGSLFGKNPANVMGFVSTVRPSSQRGFVLAQGRLRPS